MKLVVIHGGDTVRSRNRFHLIISSVRKKGWEVVNVGPEENVRDIFSSGSLFYRDSLYVIEHPLKISVQDWSWIGESSDTLTGSVLVYSSKELTLAFLKKLPKSATIEKFDYPKILFTFLDSVVPGNLPNSLKVLHLLLKQTEADFVFVMLSRHLRDLFWVKKGRNSMNYPDWRLSKLERQAGKFRDGELEAMLVECGEIDMKVKKGKIDMEVALDLLLASHLQ